MTSCIPLPPKDDRIDTFANEPTPQEVVEMARQNHLWINAFRVINPSPETLQDIGASVLHMAKQNKRKEYGADVSYITVAIS